MDQDKDQNGLREVPALYDRTFHEIWQFSLGAFMLNSPCHLRRIQEVK